MQMMSVTGVLGWEGDPCPLPGDSPGEDGTTVRPAARAEQVMFAAGALGPGADPSAGPCTGNPRFRTGVGYGGHPAGGAAAGYPGKVLLPACAPEIVGWRCQQYLLYSSHGRSASHADMSVHAISRGLTLQGAALAHWGKLHRLACVQKGGNQHHQQCLVTMIPLAPAERSGFEFSIHMVWRSEGRATVMAISVGATLAGACQLADSNTGGGLPTE